MLVSSQRPPFRDSDGIFTLAGQMEDTKAAITHLLESELAFDSLTGVYGSSYISAVAVCAAAQDSRINAVCLRAPVYDTLWFANTFMIPMAVDNIIATDPSQIRGIDDPETRKMILSRMIEDAKEHNPMKGISEIALRPVLIIHGTDDLGIDLAGVKRLFELAGEPKDLVIVEEADHELSNPVAYEITTSTVVEWFSKQWEDK